MEHAAAVSWVACLNINFQTYRAWEEYSFPPPVLDFEGFLNKHPICWLCGRKPDLCIHISNWVAV